MIFGSSGKYRAVMCAPPDHIALLQFPAVFAIHEEDNSGQSRLRPARSRGTRGLAGGPRHRRSVNQRAMGRAMPTCDCCLTEKADAQVKLRPHRPGFPGARLAEDPERRIAWWSEVNSNCRYRFVNSQTTGSG